MPVAKQLRSESEYHQSFWAEAHPKEGRRLVLPKPSTTPTRNGMLAAWSSKRTAWQITGRKGSRDGSGKQSPMVATGRPKRAPHQHHNQRPGPTQPQLDNDLAGPACGGQETQRTCTPGYDTLSARDQPPTRPPSFLVITMVIERGRLPAP